MPIVRCQRCGESDDLTGTPAGTDIEITCNRCGHSWLRDTEPTCPTCDGRNLHAIKEPLIQRARGTAYSVVGERTIYLCEVCDADEVARRLASQEIERAPREDPWK